MVKNVTKLRRRFILYKINKNMKRKPAMKCFVYENGYEVTYTKFKTLQLHNFVKTDQNTTKLCTSFFLQKINKHIL